LKGVYRERISAAASEKGALRAYSDSFDAVQDTEVDSLNYTSVISPSVIRNVASESNRDRNSLEKIIEAVEQRRLHEYDPLKKFPGLIRNTVLDPCAVYSYTEEQMSIFTNCINESSWERPLQVSCDTSGDIFPAAKTSGGKKKFFNFAFCLSSTNMTTLPIAEMLTLKVDAKNVTCFLSNFVCDLEKLNSAKSVKLPELFCTDYTWVNIHPILNVFMKTDIHKYLEDTFKHFECKENSEKSVLMLDKLHLIKFLLVNSRKIAEDKYIGETFVAVFLYLLKCRTKIQIENHWVAMIRIFGARAKSEEHQRIIQDCLSRDVSDDYENKKDLLMEAVEDGEPDYLCKKPIKKSSKFYGYFQSIYDKEMLQISIEEDAGKVKNDNIFFCPKLLSFVLDNYLPLFPLMSLFFVPNEGIKDLPTTSPIENHWRNIKLFFQNIPLEKRYVTVYFTLMLSYFNSKTKEHLTMKKSKALYKKLTPKRKRDDNSIFYPNFEEKKKRKIDQTETDYNEEDGYTLRKQKDIRPRKYVQRKIDFNLIEKRVSELDAGRTKSRKIRGKEINNTSEKSSVSVGDKSLNVKKRNSKIDLLLGLPRKEDTVVKQRKRRSCTLCRSVEHKRKGCPYLPANLD
jgi:hypothetical protein